MGFFDFVCNVFSVDLFLKRYILQNAEIKTETISEFDKPLRCLETIEIL